MHADKAAVGAGMEFVEHRIMPWAPLPLGMAPAIAFRIDHQARPMDIVDLRARGGVGHGLAGLQAIEIGSARRTRHFRFEPAVRLNVHHGRAAAVDLEADLLLPRRPQAEPRPVAAKVGRTEWQLPGEGAGHLAAP